MKKVRLDVERPSVESFDTAGERGEAGTVRGNMSVFPQEPTEPRYCTRWDTCQTCGQTCFDPSCEETICQATCLLPDTCGCTERYESR